MSRTVQELRDAADHHRALAEHYAGDLTGLGHSILAQDYTTQADALEDS